MNTVGLECIAVYLPDGQIDNLERGRTLGFEDQFIRDKVGFLKLTKCKPGQGTLDLAQAAVGALATKANLDLGNVDCLVVCTQNPDGYGLPNTASALHAQLGLPMSCAAFDISLGCSGFVYGLSVVQAFMQANGLSCGLFVTSDPYSKIVDPNDRATAILFGDGATASLLQPAAKWAIGLGRFGSDGKSRSAIEVGSGGTLSMNGRNVFAFSASIVPPLVDQVLAANNAALSEIDMIVVHQGSKYIVDEIRRRLGLSEDAVPFGATETGNLVSSSIPVLLERTLETDVRKILIAGFGVGLSWGANLLTRQGE